VLLRFYVTGPPGTHPVTAHISDCTGHPPEIAHDRELSLDDGATGHIDLRLGFDTRRAGPCTLTIMISDRRLGAFLVQPAGPQL
jgi:hypothetical protein